MISRGLKMNGTPVEVIREDLVYRYRMNDRQHQIEHIDTVWENAKNILLEDIVSGYAESVYGKIDDRLILLLWTAVYYHDIMVWKDRKNHHTLAGEYILNDKKLNNEFNRDELMMIYHAVVNHRASESFPSINYSYLTEVVRTADRGKPTLEAIIIRSNILGMQPNEETFKLLEHLVIKYGPDGYTYENDVYYKNRFKKEISKLEKDMVKLYKSLTSEWISDESINTNLLMSCMDKINKHLIRKGVEL